MQLTHLVEIAGEAAELAGVVLILTGLGLATMRFALLAGADPGTRYQRYRHDMARAILLGLEVLVAADIIQTVTFMPTMDSMLLLAMIVALRTFLSWSLMLELEGRWPWQRPMNALQSAPILARAPLCEPQTKGEIHV